MSSNNIKKDFFKYVSLSILGMLGTSCYILVDTFFIAQGAGSSGLTALNIAIPAYNFMQALGLMIGIGGATRFTFSKGKRVFTQSAWLILLSSMLFLCLGAFAAQPLARLLGANQEVLADTSTYLRVILCFSPAFLFNDLLLAFIRNDGKPHLVTIAMIAGSLFNIVFDYIFIFPMKMGMLGAALATGASPIVSIIIMSSHFFKKENTFHLHKLRPTITDTVSICSLGASSFVMETANGIVVLVFNIIILRIAGNIGVAAYGVVTNIAIIVTVLFTGLTQGMQPLLSREYSRQNEKSLKQLYRMGAITVVAMALLVYTTSFAFTDPIISVFNSEESIELLGIARIGIRLYFLSFFFGGLNIMKSGYFSAINQAKKGFGIAILRGIVILIPVVLTLSSLFKMTGIWLSIAITDFIVLILFLKPIKVKNDSSL